MSGKRKRVVLSIEQKLEVIKRFERGESASKLSNEFNIGIQTVRDLKKQKSQLLSFAANYESRVTKRKTMKSATLDDLDKSLFMWFSQKRAEGIPISGPILVAKAKFFNDALGLSTEFNASSGWLHRFKSRHGIRELSIQGEKLSGDSEAVAEFRKTFKAFITENQLSTEQIYNADETGLYYRRLPSKSLASENEKSAPGYKIGKERLTILCAANSAGTHKLKLSVIGKAKKPRCFKGLDVNFLPVDYFDQKGAWMERDIFEKWFKQNFVPAVSEHLTSISLPKKAVLLIDNAPSHPLELNLISDDGQIKAMFLPPNVTSLCQPMDQCVIASMKNYYRFHFMKRLVEEDEDLVKFWKSVTIKDAIYAVSKAWDAVKQTTLIRAWNKLLGEVSETQDDFQGFENTETTVAQMRLILMNCAVKEFENVDDENMKEWVESDKIDPGYRIFSDEEILNEINGESESENEDEVETLVPEQRVSCKTALDCMQTVITYFEQQTDTTFTDILQLQNFQTKIRQRERDSYRQKKLTDFFKKN